MDSIASTNAIANRSRPDVIFDTAPVRVFGVFSTSGRHSGTHLTREIQHVGAMKGQHRLHRVHHSDDVSTMR